MHILKNTNFDFVRWRWHAIALSWVIVIAGLIAIGRFGVPLGVEFSGGSIVIVKFDRQTDLQQVRTALESRCPAWVRTRSSRGMAIRRPTRSWSGCPASARRPAAA